MMWIYKITNEINGKGYIGKSKRPEKRMQEHFNRRKYENFAIHHAIKKYGKDNFRFEIIAETTKEEVDELEIKLIAEHKTFITEHGYNETRGGDGGIMSEDVRKKISETLKRKYANGEIKIPEKSEEGRRRISEAKMGNSWNKGRVFTEEHRKNLSKSSKGKKKRPRTEEEKKRQSILLKTKYASGELVAKSCSEEQKEKLRQLHTGKKHTEETKLKMSLAQKGISKGPFTESHREAISKAHFGKKLSEETKQKISEIHKGKSKPQIEVKCPHCSKSGGQSNMTRYHFDNCKLKPQG